jgi:hypothetical protein
MSRHGLVCLVLCAVLLSGCSSMRTIQPITAPGQPAFGPVTAGDTVRVRLRNGERLEFEVQQVQGDTLIAKGGTAVSRADIVQLQRESFSPVKTWSLVGGITAAAILWALALASLTVSW